MYFILEVQFNAYFWYFISNTFCCICTIFSTAYLANTIVCFKIIIYNEISCVAMWSEEWAKSGPRVPSKNNNFPVGVTLTDFQILGCELHKNAFGGRAPPGPAGGAIAVPQTS